MSDTKFTDRHVREYPDLRRVALDYLRGYRGEFEPLVAARELDGYSDDNYPTGVIRMVLNVMRTDPRAVGLLPTLLADPQQNEPLRLAPRREKPAQQERARHPFDLKVQWKLPYIAASHKQATAYHLFDAVKSSVRYWPAVQEYRVDLRPVCGAALRTGVALAEPPADRHECRQCRLVSDMIAARAEENAERMAEWRTASSVSTS